MDTALRLPSTAEQEIPTKPRGGFRVLHTSDWHLGHTLMDIGREREHEGFLAWLLTCLAQLEVDALLVAGDVFDSANPPGSAQERWYRFVVSAQRANPHLSIVVIGGNHDSAVRLEAPVPLLSAFGTRVFGGVRQNGRLRSPEDFLVALKGRDGQVAAHVAAVPYVRNADLPGGESEPGPDEGDRLVAGIRSFYQQVLRAARERARAGEAMLAMGHCFLQGGTLSEESERKIQGGNLNPLPVDMFPEELAYVALGHLHRPQRVQRDSVRYSGSPIPLSLSERRYPHQVLIADLEGGRLTSVSGLTIPRFRQILRVPESGALPLEALVAALQGLSAQESGGGEPEPLLEVGVSLTDPDPRLREKIEAAICGKGLRLVKIARESTGNALALGDALGGKDLRELTSEEVFLHRWRRTYAGEPSPEVRSAFLQLVEAAQEAQNKGTEEARS